MRVEEQGVGSPRERLGPPVHVVIGRSLRKHSAILVLDVLDVGSVFGFSVVYPRDTSSNL